MYVSMFVIVIYVMLLHNQIKKNEFSFDFVIVLIRRHWKQDPDDRWFDKCK